MTEKALDYFGGEQYDLDSLHSTKATLDYSFGTWVGSARDRHLGIKSPQEPQKFDELAFFNRQKEGFVSALEEAIKEDLPEYESVIGHHLIRVRHNDLRRMLELAKNGDWSNKETIMSLYEMYCRITRTPYNERMLLGPIKLPEIR